MSALNIIITAAIFFALIANLSRDPGLSSRSVTIAIIITFLTGLLFYGYGYAVQSEYRSVAIIRALLGVCGMYVGRTDDSVLKLHPFCDYYFFSILFWFGHLCAFYATASACMRTLGAEAMRRFRMRIPHRGNLIIIYGLSDETFAFGSELAHEKSTFLLFVDSSTTSFYDKSAASWGSVVRCDRAALNPNAKFLQSIGLYKGTRHFTLYTLHSQPSKNLSYALAMKTALEEAGYPSERTTLSLSGQIGQTGDSLMAGNGSYGFGNVLVFDRPTMVARVLTEFMPPASVMTFDENYRATNDFDCLIVGFGRIGQAVLRGLVTNGQFDGSTFHATVFATDVQHVIGSMHAVSPALLDEYDIKICADDARSDKMYQFLNEHKKTLRYIAICVGNEQANGELATSIQEYQASLGSTLPIFCCSQNGVIRYNGPSIPVQTINVFSKQVLADPELDKIAIGLNHMYTGGPSAKEDWDSCDYFSRMSCLASADYLQAFLPALKIDPQDILSLEPGSEKLTNLGKSEHLRWCAFHFASGYQVLEGEMLDERIRTWKEKNAEGNAKGFRITKDTFKKRHACLIPWNELPVLADTVSAATGETPPPYQQMDIDNIIAICKVMVES